VDTLEGVGWLVVEVDIQDTTRGRLPEAEVDTQDTQEFRRLTYQLMRGTVGCPRV
jgi:hypothetical protein